MLDPAPIFYAALMVAFVFAVLYAAGYFRGPRPRI